MTDDASSLFNDAAVLTPAFHYRLQRLSCQNHMMPKLTFGALEQLFTSALLVKLLSR